MYTTDSRTPNRASSSLLHAKKAVLTQQPFPATSNNLLLPTLKNAVQVTSAKAANQGAGQPRVANCEYYNSVYKCWWAGCFRPMAWV